MSRKNEFPHIEELRSDLAKYVKETGKATNEVLASKALDFSIRFSKEMANLAPTPAEIEEAIKANGYAVRVRKKVVDKLGGSYKGKTRRRVKGKTLRNKRAVAVAREIAIRRSSVKFLSRSLAKWPRRLNRQIPEGSRDFGKAFTRRKTSVIGKTKGFFTRKKDRVLVVGSAYALRKVSRRKGNLSDKVMQQVSADTRSFLARRVGKEYARNIKRAYR